MPHQRLRFSAATPEGVRYFRDYNLDHFTKEEAQRLGEIWKKWIRAGMPEGGRVEKNEEKKEEESSSEEESKSEYSLPRKDIESMVMPGEGGASALFLGSTRSGKTTMIKAFHEKFFGKHINVLHTGSPQAATYNELKKKCAVAPGFCDDIIEECIKINMRTENHYKFAHIIDDCVSSKNNATMIRLLTIGRNHNQSTLISGQELSILNAIGRSNINFVFLGKLNSSMAVEKVIKCYLLSHFPSGMKMPDKIKLYNDLTKDHNWIVLDAIDNVAFITKLEL